ncbi:hypothetical protein AAUPMB_05478 [Pasteurella multocida subsp. multocida str. Anand1_buffalo]|nr:hypothetical protein AAUPMB_05478 [Pasteurella multocida subsp. multocida str. Anand1_buffalo]
MYFQNLIQFFCTFLAIVYPFYESIKGTIVLYFGHMLKLFACFLEGSAYVFVGFKRKL